MSSDNEIEDARRMGERLGAAKFAKQIVSTRLEKLTGRTAEQVAATMEHVDPESFLDELGDVDDAKVSAFAGAMGGAPGSGGNVDMVAQALGRVRQAAGGGGSHISEKRKEVAQSMSPGIRDRDEAVEKAVRGKSGISALRAETTARMTGGKAR